MSFSHFHPFATRLSTNHDKNLIQGLFHSPITKFIAKLDCISSKSARFRSLIMHFGWSRETGNEVFWASSLLGRGYLKGFSSFPCSIQEDSSIQMHYRWWCHCRKASSFFKVVKQAALIYARWTLRKTCSAVSTLWVGYQLQMRPSLKGLHFSSVHGRQSYLVFSSEKSRLSPLIEPKSFVRDYPQNSFGSATKSSERGHVKDIPSSVIL
jgi:hypothetical protein